MGPRRKGKSGDNDVGSVALDEILRKYGSRAIIRMGDAKPEDIPCISTGSLMLDLAIGGNARPLGFPIGKISEIVGNPGSGKTTIALSSMANAQRMGMTCVYFDTEYALDISYAERIGVSIDDVYLAQPDTAEECLNMIYDIAQGSRQCLIVLDSVAALTPTKEAEGESGDAHVGLIARMMSQLFRRVVGHIKRNEHTLLLVNQYRANISGMAFGKKRFIPGGKAQEFYSSVIIDVARASNITSGGEDVGIEVIARVIKNKVAKPFQTARIPIRFGEGIDRAAELVDIALAIGVLQKSGSWYRTEEGETVGQGRDACREWALNNERRIRDGLVPE